MNMNHDATHCADYKEDKCPKSCYRAELTEDFIKRKTEFIGIPISYASFAGTSECGREYKPKTEGMKMLEQMEEVLCKCDKPGAEERTPTMKSFLVFARAVYFLMEKHVRNTHK